MGDKDRSGQMTRGELRVGIEPSPIQPNTAACMHMLTVPKTARRLCE